MNKQQQKSDVRESCSMFVQPWQSKVMTSIEVKYVGNDKPGYGLKRVIDFATKVLFGCRSHVSLNPSAP